MIGFLIRRGESGHYLQWHPAPKVFEFTAAEQRHASVFTDSAALHLVGQLAFKARVVPDGYWRREPKFLLKDVQTRTVAA